MEFYKEVKASGMGYDRQLSATIGLHYQKSQIYQEQAKQYGEEIEKLEEEIKKNPADTALIEQKHTPFRASPILSVRSSSHSLVTLLCTFLSLSLSCSPSSPSRFSQ